MFGIGPLEFVVIAVVAVIFIGPDKLPETMKKFGKFFVQARRHANDVKDTLQQVIHDAERELEVDRIREIQAKIQAAHPSTMLEAEIRNAGTVSHEDDHAPYGAEAHDPQHDHSNNPDYISMDHFTKAAALEPSTAQETNTSPDLHASLEGTQTADPLPQQAVPPAEQISTKQEKS